METYQTLTNLSIDQWVYPFLFTNLKLGWQWCQPFLIVPLHVFFWEVLECVSMIATDTSADPAIHESVKFVQS